MYISPGSPPCYDREGRAGAAARLGLFLILARPSSWASLLDAAFVLVPRPLLPPALLVTWLPDPCCREASTTSTSS